MGIKQCTVKSSKVQENEYGSHFQVDLKDYAEPAKKTPWYQVEIGEQRRYGIMQSTHFTTLL